MRSRYASAFACTLVALLSACGGSGGGGGVQPLPIGSSTPAPMQQTANINFKLFIPAVASVPTAAKSNGVRTMDFSASTRSVTIAIGTQVLKTADVSATSSLCTAASGGGRNCTVGVSAPSGNDTFTLTAYDQANGAGNAIAHATMVETVSSTATSVNVAVTGTIVKLTVALSNPYPPVGTAATSTVTVTGIDIDGNVVLGPYASPITLQDSDTSGVTTLSATTLTSSSNSATLSYTGAISAASATITASLTGVASATATFAAEPAYGSYYDVPKISLFGTPGWPGVWKIAKGSDGNMWVACVEFPEIIKVNSNGGMTAYAMPDTANGLALGSDQNFWVAEANNNAIAKVTTSGVATEYTILQAGQIAAIPTVVALGPDGNVWFNDGFNQVYGKITPSGTVTEYPTYGQNAAVGAITSGPDGNLWMLDASESKVWKVSTSGQILSTYPLPTANSDPEAIAVGPDGNFWIGYQGVSKIARMTPSGTVTEFNVPSPSGYVDAITAGPDGRMWFAEQGPPAGPGKIGYVTLDGTQIRDFLGGTAYHVHDLAFDSHNVLWYVALSNYTPFSDEVIGTLEY